MKKKIAYLNVVLTIIAVALTVMILQNAHVIQHVNASGYSNTMDVNITEINGSGFWGTALPVEIQ